MFEKPEPLKRSKDPRLHRMGSRIPCLVQHTIDGDRAQTRQAFARLPVVSGDRQGPEDYTRIALWPTMQTPAEISEVEMPHCDMEQYCL